MLSLGAKIGVILCILSFNWLICGRGFIRMGFSPRLEEITRGTILARLVVVTVELSAFSSFKE